MQQSPLTALCFIPVLALWVIAALRFDTSTTAAQVTRGRAVGTSLALTLCFMAQGATYVAEGMQPAAYGTLLLVCSLASAFAHLAQLATDADKAGFFHHKRTRLLFSAGLLGLAAAIAQLPLVASLAPTVFASLIFTRFLAGQGRQTAERQNELEALRARLIRLECELRNETLTKPVLGDAQAVPSPDRRSGADRRKKA